MSRWAAALRFLGVGFYIAGSILLGIGAGLWLDDKFDTRPIMVILGLLLGLMVAFWGVYRMLLPLLANKEDKGNS